MKRRIQLFFFLSLFMSGLEAAEVSVPANNPPIISTEPTRLSPSTTQVTVQPNPGMVSVPQNPPPADATTKQPFSSASDTAPDNPPPLKPIDQVISTQTSSQPLLDGNASVPAQVITTTSSQAPVINGVATQAPTATLTETQVPTPGGAEPTNKPPAPPDSVHAGPPDAPVSSKVQSDTAQFQKWLQGNVSQETLKPVAQNSVSNAIPPPPVSTQVPPPPTKLVKRKYKTVRMKSSSDAPLVESPPLTYAEQKEIMRGMAPPLAIPPNPDSDVAFNSMMQQNMPLTPEQVIKLRQLIDTSQRAAAVPPTIPPKPVSTTLMINLAPGSTPPAIRLAQGYISSLVFVDSTGSPWPVAAYDIGDPKIVNIQWDGKSNIIMMQATSPYSSGNLVIRLVGLETPVTLELVSGQRVVDYRTDIHVPGIGPNAKELPTGTGLPESANQLLLSVLDGVAPPGSKQLKVIGGDAEAWALGDKMYLRTRLTLLSPGWIGKMSSPDGMMAYELQLTSSILVSQYGNPIELKIGGF